MSELGKETRDGAQAITRVLAGAAVAAGVVYTGKLLLAFFGPAVPYRIPQTMDCALDSEEFAQFLSLITNGALRGVHTRRHRNGREF